MDKQQIIEINVEESKKNLSRELTKDYLIMFFTRVLEDLKNHDNPQFFGRVKNLYELLFPFDDTLSTKDTFDVFKKSDLVSSEGLVLSDQERFLVGVFRDNLNSDGTLKNHSVMKGRINGILTTLCKSYLPHSSEYIEPFLLGKLICFFGGLKSLCFKPASTIQVLGAEKAMFKHTAQGSKSPKYGLLYYSKSVQQADTKAKQARILANKLAISLRQDYFSKIKNSNDGKV